MFLIFILLKYIPLQFGSHDPEIVVLIYINIFPMVFHDSDSLKCSYNKRQLFVELRLMVNFRVSTEARNIT